MLKKQIFRNKCSVIHNFLLFLHLKTESLPKITNQRLETILKPLINTMKKIALSILVAVAAFFGAGNAQAQISVNFTTPAMDPQFEAMAKQVVEMQTTNPDGANKIFAKLMGKIKKNKEQATAVGKFFLDNNIYPCAKQCATAAYNCDYAYEPGLLLGVGVHLMRKDYGQAGTKLDEIIANNPNNLEAKRLSARVYKYVNPYAAKSILDELVQLDPNYEDIQKQLGDICYMLDDYKGAVAAYGKYFAKTPNPNIMDLLSGENYLIALMNQGDFYSMIDMVPVFEPLIDPAVDIVIPRMKFIAQMQTQDYGNAANTVSYVADHKFNDSVYIDYDYKFASAFFKLAENYDKAAEMQKGRFTVPNVKDETILEANKEVADLLRQAKRPEEGIEYYEKYVELKGADKLDFEDRIVWGDYYNAVKRNCTDPEKQMEIVKKADALYAKWMEEYHEEFMYPYYRAQLWIIDTKAPEVEAVKWYNATVDMINALPADRQEKAKTYKLRSLQYLLWDAAMSGNRDNAKKFMNQVLEIDPNDGTALQVKQWLGA